MNKQSRIFSTLSAIAASVWGVASYADSSSVVNLDGVKLCVPEQYAEREMPFWLKPIAHKLDNSYDSFLFYIQPETLKAKISTYRPDTYIINGKRRFTDKGVIVTNISAISGQSGAQQRVIELVQNGDTEFEKSDWPRLHKITHYESGREWSLVRSKTLPEHLDSKSLNKWIAAYCGVNGVDERYTCHIQRIVGDLSYDVSIPDLNMENMEEIESVVEEMLILWEKQCGNET